jgi:hypothetical protein
MIRDRREDATATPYIHPITRFPSIIVIGGQSIILTTLIRHLARVTAVETQLPKVTSSVLKQANGYRTESLNIESKPGIALRGVLGIPGSGSSHPVLIWMDPTPKEAIAQGPDVIRMVKAGNLVVAFHARDVLGEPQAGPEQLALGQYMPELLRAIICHLSKSVH